MRRIAAFMASSRGVFVTTVLAGSVVSLAFLGIGGSSHTVTAQFRDADGLVVGNEVRVAGVAAGSVSSVALKIDSSSGDQFAEVTMTIDASQWPLHRGTRVAVKPKGVLSNVFVELDPGSPHSPSLGDRPFFALSQTRSPVSLQELNNVFTPSVREAIRTQLQEGVLAFGSGGAQSVNDLLAFANPLTFDTMSVTDVLATRSPQLDNLNFEFDTISGELAREDSNLRPLITNLDTLLGAIADRQASLQGTLEHAGNVFGDLSSALSAAATQDDLKHIFQAGPESLSCANSIANYLYPLIHDVNPYIRYSGTQPAPYPSHANPSHQSLDDLLVDFVTGTGYNSTAPPYGQIFNYPVDMLRADQFVAQNLPFRTFPYTDSGGLTLSHNGYTNASLNGHPVYEEQPPLTGRYPTLQGCAPPGGLP